MFLYFSILFNPHSATNPLKVKVKFTGLTMSISMRLMFAEGLGACNVDKSLNMTNS